MAIEEHWSGPYRDDRVYVMRITNGATRPEAPGEFVTGPIPPSGGSVASVLLITYRNVPSLPATRVDNFESIEKAIEYVKKIEPTCPRVSLEGRPPEPTPSWEEHLRWLHRLGLRSVAEGDEPRPDWAIQEGQ